MRRRFSILLVSVSTAAPVPAFGQDTTDALTTAVSAMAKVGAAFGPSFAPDGRRVAVLTRLSGSPQVWIVPAAGGWPDQATAFDDPVDAVLWSPDGAWLAMAVAPGGGLNSQLYLMRPNGAGLKRITAGGKVNNWLTGWSHDGRYVLLSSTQRGADLDAYLYDTRSDEMKLVAKNSGIGALLDISRDGRRAVLYRLQSRGSSDLYVVDLARGTETLLTAHHGPGTFDGGQFSPDGATIYLTSNKDRDLIAFARVRLDSAGQPAPIEVLAARQDAELDGFAVTEDGTTAALNWNVGGRSELALLDLQSLKTKAVPGLPVERLGDLTFSRDGRQLAFAGSGAAAPSDVWILERSTGKVRQLTRSPHPGVDLTMLIRPELTRYPAADGLPLSGWLYRPKGAAGPGPIVLNFHGGPEDQEIPAFSSIYQALLLHGFTVFAPNVRGSSGFGKRFVNLDNGALRENAVKDIKASVDYVVQAGIADPKRVGIMGFSYGGYMVMAGLTEYPDLFAAGADVFGIVNFASFFANTEPWMAAVSTVEYGDPKKEADLLKRLSPITRLDRVKTPTIVLHGANDTNVPVVEAEQVVNNLKSRHVPVEFVLFPDEGHGWRKTSTRIHSNTSIVRWFDRYLNPHPITTP